MKRRIISVRHKFRASVALDMKLGRWAFESISFMHTLPAFFAWTFIIRSRKIRSSSSECSTSWFSSSWWRWVNNGFCFSSYFFTMDSLLNINWIMAKNVFISCLLFFFITSFFFRMRFEVILDDTVKDGISNSCGDILTASNTLLFFGHD